MNKKPISLKGKELGTSANREFRMVRPDEIEEYLTIYLNAYPAYKNIGEEGRAKYRKRYLDSMANHENINFYGLYEDGKLIAMMKLIDFTMNAFGELKKATGLMSLGVHPMHKHRGAGRDMVRFFEHYAKVNGSLVTMLLPFRIDFYKNLGYGYGTKLEEYKIPTAYLPKCSDTKNIRFLDMDEIPKMLDFQKEYVKLRNGLLYKFEDEIRDILEDSDTRRIAYFDGEKMRGYLTYIFVSESEVNYTLNRIEVSEIAYDSPEVLRALLGFIRNQEDLAQTVYIRTGEEDFHHMLPSCQSVSGNYIDYGFLETNVGAIGTMYKVLDPKLFVKETDYRHFAPINTSVRFNYYDELNHEEKTIGIGFSKKGNPWHSWEVLDDKEECAVNVKCKLSSLSSLLMGTAHFGPLARMGEFEVDDPMFNDMFDMIFHVSQKPFTNTDY